MDFNFSTNPVGNDSKLWYDHPQFKQYCAYYNDMQNWLVTYKQYLSMSSNASSVNPHQLWDWRAPDTEISTEISSMSNEESSDEADDDSLVMEISDEMLAFLEKSEKHRQQLRLQRAEEDKKSYEISNEKYSKNKKGYSRDVCLPPKDRPGAQRTAEMKLLYGNNSAMIHGMETAMQLTFDHNCDLHQPKLWPNIPLKM